MRTHIAIQGIIAAVGIYILATMTGCTFKTGIEWNGKTEINENRNTEAYRDSGYYSRLGSGNPTVVKEKY